MSDDRDTTPDTGRSIEDLPAPRATAGSTEPDPGGAAPSRASDGAMNVDPTADRSRTAPLPAQPNPTAPEAMDPGVLPRDDTPPVGSSPASATGAILSQEDTANPPDPDDVPDDPDDPGLAESGGPGTTPPRD